MQDGQLLTELIHHYAEYRDEYLAWAAENDHQEAEALINYRRALVAWYEARLDESDPFRGEVLPYITALARVYFGGEHPTDRPLTHFPRTIKLSAEGRNLLDLFHGSEAGCRELLLLADYHHLSSAALNRAFRGDESGEMAAERVDSCRTHLEARFPDAPLYWSDVVTVAGRQDLIRTLEREESRRADIAAPAAPAAAASDVKLSPRYRPSFTLPSAGIAVAAVIFGVFLWLIYDTFWQQTPDDLYTEYFTPYPNIFTDAPAQTEADRDLQRILYDYDRGDYRTAYEELLPTASAYPAAPLYLGVSALALGDPVRAQDWFSEVDPIGPYADAAEWYRGLAMLAAGNPAKARVQIERISKDVSHTYRSRAADLLVQL